ncbi:MAG: Sec-independent protein translocase protein TatA [Planctomycetota bacterium]|jgi:Sec-independent protein translocase protein TatA
MLALIGNLGPLETLLIVLVVVLVFGGRLPEVARQTMRMVAKFRNAVDELKREVNLDGEMRKIDVELRLEKAEAFARGRTVEAKSKPTPDPTPSPTPELPEENE